MMWSDGSYAGGGTADDYAAWADYETLLKREEVFVESGQFADAGESLSIKTALTLPDSTAGKTTPLQTSENSALVGYYVLECPSRAEAVRFARLAPLYGSVEIRELAEY
ncbi:YciI family protein [Agreia sp. Leaf283]|uniref:YciI family protein n=1 Tax=Agreia sp. Leaf283 TaxID=1736321 RepID=UPI00138F5447|nr:YciI family protein [Agreia sp. Leaf283]